MKPSAGSRLSFAVVLGAFVSGAGGASSMISGCAPATEPRTAASHGEHLAPPAAAVNDEGFAAAVHDLLLTDPAGPERGVRLQAAVGRQLGRAAQRFQARSADRAERGMAALTGALFLVHAGEANAATLGPQGALALGLGAREMSLLGDEGRARALYDLLLPIAPEAERADIRSHLQSLDTWIHGSANDGGAVATAGALERIAVRRRLLEPSDVALAEATRATIDWVTRALALRDKFRKTRMQPPREESAEAWRALETGPLVLASLFLRDGDIPGAVAALDHAQLRELLEPEQPQFAAALAAAAQEPSAPKVFDLMMQLRRFTGHDPSAERDPRGERDEEEFDDDRDLFGAAAFSLAALGYRLDPSTPQLAFSLVSGLRDLGMAEAAPAVLVEAVQKHPEPAVASEALAVALSVMAVEEDAGDADAARRAFHAAAPLVAVASQKALAGKVHPSAAHLQGAMGEIELREGRVDEARALFTESSREEPTAGVLLPLARIEWRDGRPRVALDDLREALSAPDAAQAPAIRGEILLTVSDITREQGDVAGARPPLTDALRDLVRSRNVENGDERASVERVLARVLGRFGAVQPAQRALERAYAAAPGDKHQAAQTIELQIGSAFVRGDLPAARDGLARALAADLDSDDLVYFALWVRLLERQLHAVGEGAPDRAFASIADDGRWVATLARFGEGKIKGDDLIARAQTPIQKYEALFYDAMDHRALGDAKGGDALLRQVVAGTGMQLSEVSLARDFLDPNRSESMGPLPPDVAIP
jgi:tetratricopeptide (TPR) repeat protein